MTKKVGYIMSRFPHLPETFILREMCELERLGWQIVLFPLIIENPLLIHDEVQPWLARCNRMPLISIKILGEFIGLLIHQPRPLFCILWRVVIDHLATPGILLRALVLVPKSIYAARLMSAQGVEHIHAHYATYPALTAWIIHQLTGISYSITVHAHDIYVEQSMLGTKMRNASFIIAISEFNREYLVRHLGAWIRDKIHIVHCGIRPDNYQLRKTPKTDDTHEFRLISIGSLQPYKGFIYLIRACALLKARGIPVVCSIIGGGKQHERLQQEIDRLELQESVVLLGPKMQHEVAELLPEADCYVQPSIVMPSGKMEGIPVAIMEAMACGLPVLATEISGIPELVKPGVTGYLARAADAENLAEQLISILASPQTAAQLAAAGRQLVLREFQLTSNVARLANYFESCL